MSTTFGTDRPLLYDVEPWASRGFAVPNFGDNIGTLSVPLRNLADEIGKAQLYIMTHEDAMRTQPPSRNTVERLGKLCNRIKSVLASRQKEYNVLRIEEGHASPDLRIWNIHPVPYFESAVLRNHWLSEYNQLCMIALTNFYQHSDNNLGLTVTAAFAADVYQYFREITRLVGVELLGLSPDVVNADTFVFLPEHYETYSPDQLVISYESLDTPGPVQSLATEDDIRPLFVGIPANLIVPNLKQYPVGASDLGLAGASLPEGAEAVDVGTATAAPGLSIGQPQI